MTPLVDGRAELIDVEMSYPRVADEENLADLVSKIDDTLANQLFAIGDFYRRTHEPRAAVFTYRYMIDRYPNSPKVPAAQAALARDARSGALDTPEPPPSRDVK